LPACAVRTESRVRMVSKQSPTDSKLQPRSHTPSFENVFPRGVVSGHLSTEQHLHGAEGAPVAEGLPEAPGGHDIGHSRKKTTETESHSPLPTVYTCRASSRSSPGKIWMTTNQITAVSACARVSRELRARALQDLGIYKES